MNIIDKDRFCNFLCIAIGSLCLGIFFKSVLFGFGLFWCLIAFIDDDR